MTTSDAPRNGNGWGNAIQIAGVLVAVMLSVFNTIKDDSGRAEERNTQALREAELRLRESITAVEGRALQGRNEIRDALLSRSTENRENITALDTRVSESVASETLRNNAIESRLSACMTKLGLFSSNNGNKME